MGNGNDSVTTSGLSVGGTVKVRLGKGADELSMDTTTVLGRARIQAEHGDDSAAITNSTFSQAVVRMGRGNDNLGVATTTMTGQSVLNGRRGSNILTLGPGNSLGSTTIKRFRMNSAPVVHLNAVAPIDENGTAGVTGDFTDTEAGDTHTVIVHWDDPNNNVDSTFAIPTTGSLTVGQMIHSSTDSAVPHGHGCQYDHRCRSIFRCSSIRTWTTARRPGNGTASDVASIQVAVFDVGVFFGTAIDAGDDQ